MYDLRSIVDRALAPRENEDFRHRLQGAPNSDISCNHDDSDNRDNPHRFPDWTELLAKVLDVETVRGPSRHVARMVYLPSSASPATQSRSFQAPRFPTFLEPFVAAVIEDATDVSRTVGHPLSNDAISQIATQLLGNLSELSAPTVAVELRNARVQGYLTGDSPEARYQTFVDAFLSKTVGRLQLFDKYPLLARRLATQCTHLQSGLREFLHRLCDDREVISETFNDGGDLGFINSLETGLSDPHRGGKTVYRVEFSSGLRLIYKPRCLAADSILHDFVGCLNAVDTNCDLFVPIVLNRDNYGWAACIDARECVSTDEIARYYSRLGSWLAVFHFLCGTDLHAGNFIAHGGYPVPVDLECVMSPRQHAWEPWEVHGSPAYRSLVHSCLTTLMLPTWICGTPDSPAWIESAIGGAYGRVLPSSKRQWKGLGTDRLQCEIVPDQNPLISSQPVYNGRPVDDSKYSQDVFAGFEQCYRMFMRHGDEWLSPDGPLTQFAGLNSRYIARPTACYREARSLNLDPRQLRDAEVHDVGYRFPLLEDFDSELAIAIQDSESRQLWNGDFPYFDASSVLAACETRDESPESSLGTSDAYHEMQQRIQSASEDDLAWQLQLSAAILKMKHVALQPALADVPVAADFGQECLAQASSIGETLAHLAIRNATGITWLTLYEQDRKSRVRSLSPALVGPWLYDGTTGIALFLANLFDCTGEQRWRRLALDTLASSIDCGRWYLQHLSPEATTAGAFTGWFSLVYASIECGLHLEDSALIEQASSLANEFPAERIDESGNPDFLAGLSGVICVLLHLESRRTSDDAVRLALRCAERIRRLPKEKGGWRVPGLARPPQGAAHGQSGIAIALTRLHAITGETWLRTMVEEMLAYERSSFDPLDQDWPDLVAPADEVRTMIGWCRGAPGMGLMRIELADHFLSLAANDAGGLRLRQEMEIAVSATRRNLGAGSDHLCCGMAGQLWALNSLAKSRQDDDLLEYIRHRTRRMLSVYRETQTWKQGNIVEGPIIPSLMSGISGIGLTLLELAGVGKISQPLTLR